MRKPWGRKGNAGWFLFAAASAAAMTIGGLLIWTHVGLEVQRPQQEPAWQWNDEARIDVCLNRRGAVVTDMLGGANLRIEGTLVGFGELSSRSPRVDIGNIVGCRDEPERYIDVQDGEGERWRIMYGLSGLKYPTPRARVGSRVSFLFDSEFHAGKISRFLLLDHAGPVLGIETGAYGAGGVEKELLSVSWGRPFGRRPSECGGERVARALRISGDTEVSVAPGQVGSVLLHGTPYRFWNVHSVAVVGTRCVDEDDWMSWLFWRE